MKKHILKSDTTNENDLRKVYELLNYPEDSKTSTDERFNNIDNGQKGGTHWSYFSKKITNHSILIRLGDSFIPFYKTSYHY